MSPNGAQAEVTLDFGPGRYRFFLPIKAEIEVERLCGGTPLGQIYDDLGTSIGLHNETDEPAYMAGGKARRHHVYHVIRLAAQYGGEAELAGSVVKVSALDATRLVDQHVDGCDLNESAPVAWAILKATLSGITLKKKADQAPSTSASTEGR